MPRTNKRQRVSRVAFVPHSQPLLPPFDFDFTPPPIQLPEPLPKWSRTKTLVKLAEFRRNKLDKDEIAPLFQNLINYKVVSTLQKWEQNVADRLVDEGICTR